MSQRQRPTSTSTPSKKKKCTYTYFGVLYAYIVWQLRRWKSCASPANQPLKSSNSPFYLSIRPCSGYYTLNPYLSSFVRQTTAKRHFKSCCGVVSLCSRINHSNIYRSDVLLLFINIIVNLVHIIGLLSLIRWYAGKKFKEISRRHRRSRQFLTSYIQGVPYSYRLRYLLYRLI